MTLADWRERVWACADAKGWHEKPRTWKQIRMLVVSELAEAFEEYRDSRMRIWWKHPIKGMAVYSDVPTGFKPEGFPIEVADAAIRLLDYAETIGMEWEDDEGDDWSGGETLPTDVSEQLDEIVARLHFDGSWGSLQEDTHAQIWAGLRACFALAKAHGFDLMAAIELKHAYNETRPYRHGGKVA